ncbi:MAG TPA: anaerobic sulfatase maturase [Bacteroides sp.]|nr:anaerobic sulfatase maturase [Bacteroides sp.]
MDRVSREFQIFVKPVGSLCNMACRYCYYLEKEQLYPRAARFRMSPQLLGEYIRQHVETSTEPLIAFSWHGGEPTMAGLDYFRKIVEIQKTLCPPGRRIVNGIQTNGTLLDDAWCSFFAREQFTVGISVDGPRELHDHYRCDKKGRSTFGRTMNGFRLLSKHGVACEILCVVNAINVRHPLEVYRFFRELGAGFITFLPLVERDRDSGSGVSGSSVPSEAFGDFLIAVFDEWKTWDIGRVKVQIFEEAVRTAFGLEHTLCIFKKTCGGVPVVEYNGDFYSCDHFVDEEHRPGNIRERNLAELLDCPGQQAFGRAKRESLTRYCLACEVLDMCNGECPKNRFVKTPDGEEGHNYLCAGYRKFFNHCRPFVEEVSRVWKMRQPPGVSP